MKKLIPLIIMLIITITKMKGQDSRSINSDVSIGFLPIVISGTSNVGDESRPIYKHIETSGLMMNLIAHIGANLPFYSTKNWSVGAKLSVGFGYQNSLKNAEGLSSYLFDFPQYIYYRNYSSNFDFSVLLGYKFTYTALNSHLMLMGIEYNIDEDTSLRLYGSLFRYKYYTQYTNGKIEPATKIGEFGFAYIYNF